MSYAIVGFGRIGQALAKAFARNGMEVSVATTRAPESFAFEAAAIGFKVITTTLEEVVQEDIIFRPLRGAPTSRRRQRARREKRSSM